MKFLLSFLILAFSLPLGAQSLKKVTVKNKDKGEKEVYTVLKSDRSIKQGEYVKYGFNKAIIEKGSFDNGKRSGSWTYYSPNGLKAVAKGSYDADVQSVVWDFFNYKGELEQRYDFTKEELLHIELDEDAKNHEFLLVNGMDTILTKLDQAPVYIGGSTSLFKPILQNIKYPIEAKNAEITGIVLISFLIDENGKTRDHKVKQGIGYDCDETSLSAIQSVPDRWIPGRLNGEAVNVVYIIPQRFQLK